jgi:nucleoside-diphosphate-sugar epimerase
LRDNKISNLSSGRSEKDWIFIDDAVASIISLLEVAGSGFLEADIGGGQLTSVRTMVEMAADIACRPRTLLNFDPAKDRPDLAFKKAAYRFPTAWRPIVTLHEGIRLLLASVR